jgi:D-alanyl-D-alanine carboxypeptidase
MRRLFFCLICVSIPFLALYGAVSCFFPKAAIKDMDSGNNSVKRSNVYVNNQEDDEEILLLTDIEKQLLVVVDRDHPLAADYEPSDLVNIVSFGIRARDNSMQLRRIIIQDLKAMFDAAEEDGHKLMVFSAYRSYKTQERVYNYWVTTLGQEEADRCSARPGYSEHQLGTAIDVTALDLKGDVFEEFGNSEAGDWMAKNAYKFGFVMSYPEGSELITGYKHEPWHFRYVGKRVAKIIFENDLIPCTYLLYLASKNKE